MGTRYINVGRDVRPVSIEVVRLDPAAVLPTQAHEWDAGYDLYSTSAKTILAPGDRSGFGTGLSVHIPEGYVGYIKPRSGLAVRHGIDVLGGVIDSGYRGEVKVLLLNTGKVDADIAHGERIAQLVVQPVSRVEFHDITDEGAALAESARGDGGFGSTGSN
jgi:dUTP pyrophosphatase